MAGLGQPAIERLRAFLRELKPGARALLIAELERGLLRGEELAGAEIVVRELRRSLRNGNSNALRFGDPARMFLRPLEPFLVEGAPDRHCRGRIARSSVEPIWRWLCGSLMAAEAKEYAERVEEALVDGDAEKAELLARSFQDLAVSRIEQAQVKLRSDEKASRRLTAQIGSPHALEDLEAFRAVLAARDGLAMLGMQLPGLIKNLSGAQLERVGALIESSVGARSDIFLYSLVLTMGRLTASWQLIRLATKAIGARDADRIAESRYAPAVNVVLDEIENRVRELSADLRSGRGVAVAALLKDIHDSLRGLQTELDLVIGSPWARQLATMRSEISRMLAAEIELMPGRVRRLMRPRPVKEIVVNSVLDPDEVAETESLIGFVAACRNYASELAINEVTQRTFVELQKCLDSGIRTLLDALRESGDAERPFRQSQVDAAVRFCGKVFGGEYASLLAKAAEVATHSGERRTAAQA